MELINEHNHHVEVPGGERKMKHLSLSKTWLYCILHDGKLLKSFIAEKAGEYDKENSAESLESCETDVNVGQKMNAQDSINLDEEISPSVALKRFDVAQNI